jgi:hypothetical protein
MIAFRWDLQRRDWFILDTYKFEAKYEGCAPDGSYLGAEILGRCQHPVVNSSGEGVFESVNWLNRF